MRRSAPSRPRAAAGARRRWMRACSVSGVSPGSTGTGLLPQDGARVDALVDQVDGRPRLRDACGERVLDGVGAGERGEQRRVHVDDSTGEAVEERRSQEVHVPGADDEPDAVPGEPAPPSRRRARRGRRNPSSANTAVGTPIAVGPLERPDARARSTRRRRSACSASISAWRFVPLPLTSTPIHGPRHAHVTPLPGPTARSRGRRRARPRPGRRRSSRSRC